LSASKLVQSLINTPLAAALKTHGFKRKTLVYKRAVGDVKHVLQVQWRPGKTRDEAELVLNLGASLPDVDRLLVRASSSDPSEYDCTVRTRVGPLRDGPLQSGPLQSGSDPWWSVSATDKGAPADLTSRVELAVIPWFALATDLAMLSKRLETPAGVWSDDSLVAVAVALALGDKGLAESRLNAEVTAILEKRRLRAAQFPNESSGGEVLERAIALGARHGLQLTAPAG